MLPRLTADGVDTPGDHVGDGTRVDVVSVEEAAPGGRTQIDGMQAGQPSIALADRGTHSIDDVRLAHV